MKKFTSPLTNSFAQLPGSISDSGGIILLLGGFLGAGKTTLIGEFARWLGERGLKVGLVANDQGAGLVDALRFQISDPSFQAAEVSGGCFCCKVDALAGVVRSMVGSKYGKPDVIIAEPVGSCADLAATLLRPLREVFEIDMVVGPLAVAVDASRFQISDSRAPSAAPVVTGLSADVGYVFLKQLEEAEVIVVTKADKLSTPARKVVAEKLGNEFRSKEVHFVSAHTGEGLEELFLRLLSKPGMDRTDLLGLDIDYDRYAAGEAELGWYNAEVGLHGVAGAFDGDKLALKLCREFQRRIASAGLVIAHLKLSLEVLAGEFGVLPLNGINAGAGRYVSIAQAVDNKTLATLNQKMPSIKETQPMIAKLLINARAAGRARDIQTAIKAAFDSTEIKRVVRTVWQEEAAFQPPRPRPIYRLTGVPASRPDNVATSLEP